MSDEHGHEAARKIGGGGLKVAEKPLSDLKPYENNPRNIGENAVAAVAESIRQFGFRVPIVVDAHGVIVCGHTRYQAAQSLGLASVPCVVADDLTPEQVKAFRLADNRTSELSAWDFSALETELDALSDAFDMGAFGFDLDAAFSDTPDFDGAESGADGYPESQAVEDEYNEELPEQPKAKRGDIYQLGRHRLMCGDSASKSDMDALMQGEMSRLTMTSPPYGVGMEYEKKGIDPWKETVFGVIDTITKYTRIICWNIGDLFGTGTQFIEPTSMYSTERMKENGFGLMYVRIWKKNGAAFTLNPYHLVSMKPVQEYEFIFGYAKLDYEKDFAPIREYMRRQADIAGLNNKILKQITGAGFMYGHWFTPHQWDMLDESNYRKIQSYCRENGIEAFLEDYAVIRRKYDDLNIFQKTLTDDERNDWGQWAIWDITTVQKREGHPAAFPVELPARLIKMHSRENDIVLEPFGGSGTTLIACEQLGRQCRIMEREPRYVDVIIDRWEKFTGQKAVLLS